MKKHATKDPKEILATAQTHITSFYKNRGILAQDLHEDLHSSLKELYPLIKGIPNKTIPTRASILYAHICVIVGELGTAEIAISNSLLLLSKTNGSTTDAHTQLYKQTIQIMGFLANKRFQQANHLLNQHKYEEAEAKLLSITSSKVNHDSDIPNRAKAYFMLGNIAKAAGKQEQATEYHKKSIELYDIVIKLSKSLFKLQLLYLRAEVFGHMGNSEDHLSAHKEILKIDPLYWPSSMILTNHFIRKNKFRTAIKIMLKIKSKKNDRIEDRIKAHSKLANIYLLTNNSKKCKENYKEGLALTKATKSENPSKISQKNIHALKLTLIQKKGQLLIKSGKITKGIQLIKTSIQNENNLKIKLQRMELLRKIYEETKDFQNAANTQKSIIEIQIKSRVNPCNAYSQLGRIYKSSKQFKKSAEAYENSFKTAPTKRLKIITHHNFATIYQELGKYYQETKQFKKSLEAYTTSFDIKQMHSTKINIVHCHLHLHQPEQALKECDQTITLISKKGITDQNIQKYLYDLHFIKTATYLFMRESELATKESHFVKKHSNGKKPGYVSLAVLFHININGNIPEEDQAFIGEKLNKNLENENLCSIFKKADSTKAQILCQNIAEKIISIIQKKGMEPLIKKDQSYLDNFSTIIRILFARKMYEQAYNSMREYKKHIDKENPFIRLLWVAIHNDSSSTLRLLKQVHDKISIEKNKRLFVKDFLGFAFYIRTKQSSNKIYRIVSKEYKIKIKKPKNTLREKNSGAIPTKIEKKNKTKKTQDNTISPKKYTPNFKVIHDIRLALFCEIPFEKFHEALVNKIEIDNQKLANRIRKISLSEENRIIGEFYKKYGTTDIQKIKDILELNNLPPMKITPFSSSLKIAKQSQPKDIPKTNKPLISSSPLQTQKSKICSEKTTVISTDLRNNKALNSQKHVKATEENQQKIPLIEPRTQHSLNPQENQKLNRKQCIEPHSANSGKTKNRDLPPPKHIPVTDDNSRYKESYDEYEDHDFDNDLFNPCYDYEAAKLRRQYRQTQLNYNNHNSSIQYGRHFFGYIPQRKTITPENAYINAAEKGDINTIVRLHTTSNLRVDCNVVHNGILTTPLHILATNLHTDALKTICKIGGFDPTVQQSDGANFLHILLQFSQTELYDELTNNHPQFLANAILQRHLNNINQKTNQGFTPAELRTKISEFEEDDRPPVM